MLIFLLYPPPDGCQRITAPDFVFFLSGCFSEFPTDTGYNSILFPAESCEVNLGTKGALEIHLTETSKDLGQKHIHSNSAG